VHEHLDALYGTSEPPEARSLVALSSLAFEQSETATRIIAWRGVEVVRAVDYPIRDKDWGTIPTRTLSASHESGASDYRLTRDFETDDGSAAGRFELSASSQGTLTFSLRLTIHRDMQLCRAGFTLLHPIDGLAGRAVSLRGPAGEIVETRFPDTISPGEPATNFVGMRYEISGVSAAIDMENAALDMEDQRNWSDASYKTYVRTATFPRPYLVRKGDIIEQRVTVGISGAAALEPSPRTRSSLRFERAGAAKPFPELAFAVDPRWGNAVAPPSLASLRRLVRLDLRRPVDFAALDLATTERSASFDLELVVSDDRGALQSELENLAAALAELGAAPDHVVALPAAYLKSYQPIGPWPAGASPMEAARAARRAFPSARIGGGALTNFTELNRCRPDIEQIDYLTHGSSATVHAADDASVFQTLEALPDVFRSAARIASGKSYRLGLISIAMRDNPYGDALAPNKERVRRTTCAFDPRARALFGAAWLVGVAAATEFANAELITLAGLGGPFAVADAHELTPSYHVLTWLHRMRGRRRYRLACGAKALRGVAVEQGEGAIALVSNGGAANADVACAGKGRVAILDARALGGAREDPFWTKNAATLFNGRLELPPYAIAFLDLAALEGE
jgi:hypothetical protein